MFTRTLSVSLAALTIAAASKDALSSDTPPMCPRPDVVLMETPQQMLVRIADPQQGPEQLPAQNETSVDDLLVWAADFYEMAQAWVIELRFYWASASCQLCRR